MTTYTRTMLANEALDILQRNGLGQSPEAEDTAKVDAKIDALVAELESRQVVSVPDLEDIEAAHFNPLAELLANECAPNFGLQKNPNVKEMAEDRLKIMVNNAQAPRKTLGIDPLLSGGGYGLSLARWTSGRF
jgi:hypothetical protein